MSRFNTPDHRARPAVAQATSPMGTPVKTPTTRTFEGAAGWERDARTEVFLRATGAMGNEATFYEDVAKRNDRLRELTREVAVEHPAWGLEFARWLRGPGNMRTASLMFAVEFVHECLAGRRSRSVYSPGPDGGKAYIVEHYNRQIIDAVCQRADEPGEILAIWTTWYGRNIPKPVKRGVADAARRLYSEYSLLKYDTASKGYRFGDVLNLVHAAPDPNKPWQGDLFQYALDRRHNPDTATIPATLTTVRNNDKLRRATDARLWLNGTTLRNAGMTWEDALSAVGSKVDKAALWAAMIPSMNIMALIRNLRNFDEAGVSDNDLNQVMHKLQDPEEIARSRQFPFRFLSAYRATEKSLRWAYPLERALNLSLSNVPALGGRTLVLVDRSPSMFPGWGYVGDPKSDISLADKAAIFGASLAVRAASPTLVWFGGQSFDVPVEKGISVLQLIKKFGQNGGTDIPSAIKQHYRNHDRVIVITDEQTRPGYFPSNMRSYGGMTETPMDALVPRDVPVFMWNLAGYTPSAMPSGSDARFTLGGLTDKAFQLVPILESGRVGVWPWEVDAQAPVH